MGVLTLLLPAILIKLGCRMVSPLVVLYCLQQQYCVPKAEKPVYNMAMADITISCTSLDKAARVSSLHLCTFPVK